MPAIIVGLSIIITDFLIGPATNYCYWLGSGQFYLTGSARIRVFVGFNGYQDTEEHDHYAGDLPRCDRFAQHQVREDRHEDRL